jgi:hypothetical protein
MWLADCGSLGAAEAVHLTDSAQGLTDELQDSVKVVPAPPHVYRLLTANKQPDNRDIETSD